MPESGSELAALRAAVDAYRTHGTDESGGQDEDGGWLPDPWDRLLGRGVRAGAVVSVGPARGKRAERSSGPSTGARGGPGELSAALALLAAATPAGGWCGVVGVPDLGVAAAVGLGVPADRLVLVPHPGAAWEQVCGTLLPGVSALLLRAPAPVPPRVAARVAAKARAARCTLITVGTDWPGAAGLVVSGARWYGPAAGEGRLTHRRVTLGREVGGRRETCPVLLPDQRGGLALAADTAQRQRQQPAEPMRSRAPEALPAGSPGPEPASGEGTGAGERSA